MSFTCKFNKTYCLKIDQSSAFIFNQLKEKIEASKLKSWINFDLIDYKLFNIENTSIIINRSAGKISALNGIGLIIISIENRDKTNVACIELQPYGEALNVILGFQLTLAILCSIVAASCAPSKYI
ncbi:hypothetical protein [Mucilaginibacter sp. PAMB04168]|uniref:hypothetical protein n=1 Tax=Mucilaginibacter sp. PAMB04168 TaxID=3138567 RepID=UPI0031F6425A